jgi:hypothetical protein
VILNDWGVALLRAGVPRRALELLDESVRIEGQRGPDIELTATMVGNRGLALLGLGRLQQARASFDERVSAAIDHSDDFTEMHAWSANPPSRSRAASSTVRSVTWIDSKGCSTKPVRRQTARPPGFMH